MTKGEQMVVLTYKELSEETKSDWRFIKGKIAYLIDYADAHSTDNNKREIELAQTLLEQVVFYLGKAIINK